MDIKITIETSTCNADLKTFKRKEAFKIIEYTNDLKLIKQQLIEFINSLDDKFLTIK